jgi:hypothetical protein
VYADTVVTLPSPSDAFSLLNEARVATLLI